MTKSWDGSRPVYILTLNEWSLFESGMRPPHLGRTQSAFQVWTVQINVFTAEHLVYTNVGNNFWSALAKPDKTGCVKGHFTLTVKMLSSTVHVTNVIRVDLEAKENRFVLICKTLQQLSGLVVNAT